MILNSDKKIEETEHLLVELNQAEQKILLLDEKILLRDEKILRKEDKIEQLTKEKEKETVFKLHYQHLLTVRSVIENFEKSFGEKLQKKNISRIDKWKEFLGSSEEQFKPFRDAGLTIEKVSSTIDVIFKRYCTDIHTVHAVEGLEILVRGILTTEQVKIVEIIIQNSPWKDLITVK